jgi:hypothetical protein
MTSGDIPDAISLQFVHWSQGLIVGPVSQFKHFAYILAVDVLPHPLGPENR